MAVTIVLLIVITNGLLVIVTLWFVTIVQVTENIDSKDVEFKQIKRMKWVAHCIVVMKPIINTKVVRLEPIADQDVVNGMDIVHAWKDGMNIMVDVVLTLNMGREDVNIL